MTPAGIVITSIVPYMLLLIGLGLTVVTDVYISGFHKKLMILILALTASLRDGAELLVRIFVLTNNPVPIGTGLSTLTRPRRYSSLRCETEPNSSFESSF